MNYSTSDGYGKSLKSNNWYFNHIKFDNNITYFHIRYISCSLTVTRQVSRVEQELLTFPEHMS